MGSVNWWENRTQIEKSDSFRYDHTFFTLSLNDLTVQTKGKDGQTRWKSKS